MVRTYTMHITYVNKVHIFTICRTLGTILVRFQHCLHFWCSKNGGTSEDYALLKLSVERVCNWFWPSCEVKTKVDLHVFGYLLFKLVANIFTCIKIKINIYNVICIFSIFAVNLDSIIILCIRAVYNTGFLVTKSDFIWTSLYTFLYNKMIHGYSILRNWITMVRFL